MEFEEVSDKLRILEGCPWIFDGFLIILANFDGFTPPSEMIFDYASFWVRMYDLPLVCMGKNVGYKIRASVEEVEDVDIVDGDPGWGEFLRVKIKLDLRKPLTRGRMLHLNGRSLWIGFKYEKLPRFCYKCGVILHGRQGCRGVGSISNTKQKAYGQWLRVVYPIRRNQGDLSYRRQPQDNGVGRNFSHVQQKDDEGLPSEEGFGSEEEGHFSRSPTAQVEVSGQA